MLYALKQEYILIAWLSLSIAGKLLVLWATRWLEHLPTRVNANYQLCKDYWNEIRITFLTTAW